MSSVAERISSDIRKLMAPDFAETFRCTNSTGTVTEILGIFDANFSLESSLGSSFGAKATAGTFATEDISTFKRGDTFYRLKTSTTYYLLHPEGDGFEDGLTVLIFSKDPPHG
jgi:hypothetical protein